ncbi:hypothetical protein [Streptomyces sp. NPDC056463]|uniref:hypothetical protein n=1 Tax=Streptomyces sp. NPDC056463 TaxID=3345827 RepID=UPI0036840193
MNEYPLTAPPPMHGNTTDPLWRRLWDGYEPLITGLRRIPLNTDVEISGGEFAITAELIDGSHLWIASTGDLPLNPSEAEGFHVRRAHSDNPTVDELVYNSTPDGAQAEHGNNVVPLLTAISTFITERHLAPPVIDLFTIRTIGANERHRPHSMQGRNLFSSREEAVKEYGQMTHRIEQETSWRLIYQAEDTTWPVTVWDTDGGVITLFVADEGQALS